MPDDTQSGTQVRVTGPDKKTYLMPPGTTKEQAIAYFRRKGITGGPPSGLEYTTRIPEAERGGNLLQRMFSPENIQRASEPPSGAGPLDPRRAAAAAARLISAPVSLLRPPVTAEEAGLESSGGYLSLLAKRILEPTIETGKKTAEAARETKRQLQIPGGGDPMTAALKTLGLGAATAVPVAGPAVAGSYERLQTDPLGALSELVMGSELGEAGRVPEAIRDILPARTPRAAGAAGVELPRTGLVRGAVRGTMGIGKRFVEREAKATAREAAEASRARAEVINKRIGEGAQANRIIQEKNAQKLADHAEDVRTVTELNTAGQEAVSQRSTLAGSIEAQSSQIGTQVKDLASRIRGVGKSKFEAVAEATEGESIPASTLANVVDYAEENLIRGSAESIKQFRDIARRAGDAEDLSDLTKGSPDEHIDFRNLQGYYTEMGERLASETLPGDVYRAVRFVRDQIGRQMEEMASRRGVGAALYDARAYWRQYEQTFNDMRAVSQGGSPVARALRAVDPSYISAPFLGKAGARAIAMIERYSPELAKSISKMGDDYRQMSALPKKFTPKEIPEAPALGTPHVTKLPEAATPTDLMERLRDARQREILRISGPFRRFNPWDLGAIAPFLSMEPERALGGSLAYIVLKHGIGTVLEHPRVIRWLSTVTEGDLRTISRLPPEDLAQVKQGLAELYAYQLARGLPITPTPAMRKFLGIHIASSSEMGAEATRARAAGNTAVADVLDSMAKRSDLQKAKDTIKVIEENPEGEGGGSTPPPQLSPPEPNPEAPAAEGPEPKQLPFPTKTIPATSYDSEYRAPTGGFGPTVFMSEMLTRSLDPAGKLQFWGQNMSVTQAWGYVEILDAKAKSWQAVADSGGDAYTQRRATEFKTAANNVRKAIVDAKPKSGISFVMRHEGDIAPTIKEEEFHNRQRMASKGPYYEGHVTRPQELTGGPIGQRAMKALRDSGYDEDYFKKFPMNQILETAVKIHKGDHRFWAQFTAEEMADWMEQYYMQVIESMGPEAVKALQDPELTSVLSKELMERVYDRVRKRIETEGK